MKTKRIAKGIELHYNETDKVEAEFADLFTAQKKVDHVTNPPAALLKKQDRYYKEVEQVEREPGFVGSGRWVYSFKGERFEVRGSSNGKGFWGTTYRVEKLAVGQAS